MSHKAILANYVLNLQSSGRTVFSREEAERTLGIGRGAFWDAAERLQRKHHLVGFRRGFYLIVPPQYLSWGAPPPTWYIDDLMRHEGRPYYVGLLKAAELHGAAHQAVMEFQVVTNRQISRIRVGRSVLAFYYRRDLAVVSDAIEERKTDTGKMKLSSAELTAFDLLRYPRAAGGLGNIATVLSELAEKIDAKKLGTLVPAFERSVTQRLGYLMDRHRGRTDALFRALSAQPLSWVELDPAAAGDSDLSPKISERNERWRVVVRGEPQADT